MRHFLIFLSYRKDALIKTLLFFLTFFCFFAGLGFYGILDNNEGLYAQIAKEMLQTGDMIIPRLNGGIYIEKPPLLYWLVCLCFKIFGVHEWSARLVPALSGFGTCLILWQFSNKIFGREFGAKSMVILGTSLGFILFSRMVFFDVLMTFFLTGSCVCLYLFIHEKSKNNLYLLGVYTFLALAVLTKGLLPLILLGSIWSVYFIIYLRRTHNFFAPLSLKGIMIFLVIAAPWHYLAYKQNPDFAWFYFVNEHFLRFLGKRQPQDYYSGPWYYYTYRIFVYFIPWTFLLFFPRTWITEKKADGSQIDSLDSLKSFAWVWFLVLFCFFSFSRAKANYYMVAGMPAAALLLSIKIKEVFSKKTLVFLLFSPIGLFISFFLIPSYEETFSARPLMARLSLRQEKIFLFKDYEKISSVLFYAPDFVTIVHSESQDLLYAQNQDSLKGTEKSRFCSIQDTYEKSGIIFVHKRRLEDFKKTFPKAVLIDQAGIHYAFKF